MAIEVTSGDVLSATSMLVRHMAAGNVITAQTNPNTADLDRSIVEAEAEIFGWLASYNYSIIVADWTDNALQFLSWYNALGAAYRVEQAQTGLGTSPRIPTRADSYYKQYTALLERLDKGKIDLAALGVPASSTNKLQASLTGTTHTDKNVQKQDTDAVQPTFSRDQFAHPETKQTIPVDPV